MINENTQPEIEPIVIKNLISVNGDSNDEIIINENTQPEIEPLETYTE